MHHPEGAIRQSADRLSYVLARKMQVIASSSVGPLRLFGVNIWHLKKEISTQAASDLGRMTQRFGSSSAAGGILNPAASFPASRAGGLLNVAPPFPSLEPPLYAQYTCPSPTAPP